MYSKIIVIALLALGLCVSNAAVAAMKGSGYEQNAGAYEGKGPGTEAAAEMSEVEVSGKIMFADYYSMGGNKCAAFLVDDNGSVFCIYDNMAADHLEKELGKLGGKVQLKGTLRKKTRGKYLEIHEYNIIKKGLPEKGSSYEKKGS